MKIKYIVIVLFGSLIVASYKPRKTKVIYNCKIGIVGNLTKADAG